MGMFSKILASILGKASGKPAAETPSAPPHASAPASASNPAAAGPAVAPVDMTAILDGMAAKNSEDLDWRRSIVDLLKLIGVDSSLAARKELAKELEFTGDTSDSATMNIWLHRAVMKKLAANGGKVPEDLLS